MKPQLGALEMTAVLGLRRSSRPGWSRGLCTWRCSDSQQPNPCLLEMKKL